MEYEPEYTERDERIEVVKDRIYDLEEIKKHLETGLETLNGNPDYDDLVGYFEECIKETNKLIDDNKEELNELLEEPNLYDEYNERMREYREQQGF